MDDSEPCQLRGVKIGNFPFHILGDSVQVYSVRVSRSDDGAMKTLDLIRLCAVCHMQCAERSEIENMLRGYRAPQFSALKIAPRPKRKFSHFSALIVL